MRIGLLGDVMLGRLVNEALKTRPPDYPFGDVLPLLRGCDLNLLNLECALTHSDAKVSKDKILKLELIPVVISDFQVNIAKGEEKAWGQSRMRALAHLK